MFVAVISQGMTVERVFASTDQKVCEDWATNQAKQIFGTNEVDHISVGLTCRGTKFPVYDVSISVLESEKE